MVIYPGAREVAYLEEGLPENAIYSLTETGYSNRDTFLKYLHHFQQHRRNPERFCILILDGHGSHFSLPALEDPTSTF